jgi:hypothetical protein
VPSFGRPAVANGQIGSTLQDLRQNRLVLRVNGGPQDRKRDELGENLLFG